MTTDEPPGAWPTDQVVTVVGVDDHPIVLAGVVATIERRLPQFRWTGAAETFDQLQELIDEPSTRPSIALIDLHLRDGSDPCTSISILDAQGILPVVFTSELRPVPIRRAVSAGARGLALKSDPPDRLADVLLQVSRGDFAASGELAFVLLSDPTLVAHLAPRELEVLQFLSEGIPRKAVGRRMSPPVSTATVITYVNRVCSRYRAMGRGISTVADALRAATDDGYLG